MKKNGRTIKEDILIIMRGIREFDKILPKQMSFQVTKSIIVAFTPYIAVVMSAMILNELVETQNKIKLLTYILISIGATLLLSGIGYFLDSKISVGYGRLFSTHEIILTAICCCTVSKTSLSMIASWVPSTRSHFSCGLRTTLLFL